MTLTSGSATVASGGIPVPTGTWDTLALTRRAARETKRW